MKSPDYYQMHVPIYLLMMYYYIKIYTLQIYTFRQVQNIYTYHYQLEPACIIFFKYFTIKSANIFSLRKKASTYVQSKGKFLLPNLKEKRHQKVQKWYLQCGRKFCFCSEYRIIHLDISLNSENCTLIKQACVMIKVVYY